MGSAPVGPPAPAAPGGTSTWVGGGGVAAGGGGGVWTAAAGLPSSVPIRSLEVREPGVVLLTNRLEFLSQPLDLGPHGLWIGHLRPRRGTAERRRYKKAGRDGQHTRADAESMPHDPDLHEDTTPEAPRT